MACHGMEVRVMGIRYDSSKDEVRMQQLTCIISNDEHGRTLSIDDGSIQFSISFDTIAKYLEKTAKN